MELEYVKVISALILFTVTFACTMLPLFLFKRSQLPLGDSARENLPVISFLSCFAAGVFLGTCLLHLFPDVQEQMDLIFKTSNIVPNYPVAEFLFGFGFLAVLIIEQIILNIKENGDNETALVDPDPSPENQVGHPDVTEDSSLGSANHLTTNYGTISVNAEEQPLLDCDVAVLQKRPSRSLLRSLLMLLALSLHSIFEGLAIGLQTTTQSDIRILVAVLIHKCIIAFSLGLNLSSSDLKSGSVIKGNLFFSLTSPIGILIGLVVIDLVQGLAMLITSGILQGLAAGTFLYITLFEVLPKELECGGDRMVKVACVVLGYTVVSLLLTFLPE